MWRVARGLFKTTAFLPPFLRAMTALKSLGQTDRCFPVFHHHAASVSAHQVQSASSSSSFSIHLCRITRQCRRTQPLYKRKMTDSRSAIAPQRLHDTRRISLRSLTLLEDFVEEFISPQGAILGEPRGGVSLSHGVKSDGPFHFQTIQIRRRYGSD